MGSEQWPTGLEAGLPLAIMELSWNEWLKNSAVVDGEVGGDRETEFSSLEVLELSLDW